MSNIQVNIDLARLPSNQVVHYAYDKNSFISFEGENIEYERGYVPDHLCELIYAEYSSHSNVIDWTKRGRIHVV